MTPDEMRVEISNLHRSIKEAVEDRDFHLAALLDECLKDLNKKLTDIVAACSHSYVTDCFFGMSATCTKCGDMMDC